MKQKLKNIIWILLFVCLTACKEVTLFTKLEEQEANLMLATLLRDDIKAKREIDPDGTYKLILEEEAQFSDAVELLSIKGFPRKKFETLCSTFKGEGMVSTPLEQKARYTCAKSQELSSALMSIDGIVDAQVNLVMSETDPISRKIKPASASVFLKYKTELDIEALIPKVKKLIAFGVESLPYQNVEIFTTATETHKEAMMVQQQLAQQQQNLDNKLPEIPQLKMETITHNSGWMLYMMMFFVLVIMLYFAKQLFVSKPKSKQMIVPEDDTMDF